MIKDKVALVTGGAVGIGRAISLSLAKNGAKVVINYRSSADAANDLVKEIQSFGGQAMAIKADISDFNATKVLLDEVISNYGTLNILVNNAGITDDSLMLRMSEDQFDRVILTNLKGVFNVCKHATKTLMKSSYGRIINISSVSGIKGNVGQANYSAAKAGVIGFSKTLAKEFASRNVTVNVVAPGFIETNMTASLPEKIVEAILNEIPLKRFGQVEDIAETVSFLASPRASYITGQVLSVDGGLTL